MASVLQRAGLVLPFFALLLSVSAASFNGDLNGAPPKLPTLKPGNLYSVLFSIETPSRLAAGNVVTTIASASKQVAMKSLHAGDADLYTVLRASGSDSLSLSKQNIPPGSIRFKLQVTDLGNPANLAFEPNNRWEDANPITLDSTIFASGDESSYLPQNSPQASRQSLADPKTDWFRFEFTATTPRLVHFALDLAERDNIPADIGVWRLQAGKAVPFNDGEDPVTLPHEVQALNGNKFTVRTLTTPGTYFIRVAANHPEYKLRTRTYAPPPYQDPQQATQAAIDFIIASGDSWHANTPRRGGVYDRVASVHQETSLCVACHATHFPQRAQLYALRNGYDLNYRQQQQFLAERFYNNPRPFYGFEEEGAVWARVISAPVNVLSRMSHLTTLFEEQVSQTPRPAYHKGVAEYIALYYKDRTKLPNDETNGNTPLVSAYEVAWYAWEVTRDPKIAAMIEQDDHKNLIDLCYQTLALAAIDKTRHAGKIQRNAERLLTLQRPSGQWSMHFAPNEHEAEFQTGHVLWTLATAGIARENPQVRKAVQYLLSRQQSFGGWLDPLQSFENFRTPFRETQMAILGLSSYYPKGTRKPGWGAPLIKAIPTETAAAFTALDNIWEPGVSFAQLRQAANNEDALTRQLAIEALGRIGRAPGDLDLAISSLSDPSKMVARTAAWAVRQMYSRYPELRSAPLLLALKSERERTRWGATRVFATHFSALAKRREFAEALATSAFSASWAIQTQAFKGLSQFWFWTPEAKVKGLIEDTFLTALANVNHPATIRNLKEAIYNIADENIRYLYNNWIPLLGTEADRKRAIEGRLGIESRLAGKFAAVLDQGKPAEVKLLLSALTEFELRRADVYDLKADLSTPFQPTYNRIGNDVEQIVFFGKSNDRLATALAPYLDSADPDLRRLAEQTAILLRDAPFSEVVKIAGKPDAARDAIFDKLKERLPASLPVLRAAGRAPIEPRPAGGARRSQGPGLARPDDAYFRGYVEPILTTRGKDGYACVHCHASHSIFDGTLGSAQRVIDPQNPEESLILRKPTTDAESEGTIAAKKLSHGGGIRFDIGSPEYNTILNWIRGTKP